MIPIENVPKLQALWERADAAFLSDDGYIVAMAEAAGKIYAKRQAQRERAEVVALGLAAKLSEAQKIRGSKARESKARPDEVRERRNAKRRAQRAEAKARGDVGGTP